LKQDQKHKNRRCAGSPPIPTNGYVSGLNDSIQGLKIGVLQEGFGGETSEPQVDEAVKKAVSLFTQLGAKVVPVSVPLHNYSGHIWNAIGFEGANAVQYHNGGQTIGSR
jgi:amidase